MERHTSSDTILPKPGEPSSLQLTPVQIAGVGFAEVHSMCRALAFRPGGRPGSRRSFSTLHGDIPGVVVFGVSAAVLV